LVSRDELGELEARLQAIRDIVRGLRESGQDTAHDEAMIAELELLLAELRAD
jgi:hypothetical protein